MDIQALKQNLQGPECTVIGIPFSSFSKLPSFLEFLIWSLEGKPEYGRMIWFLHENPKEFRDQINPYIRSRIIPVSKEQSDWHLHNIPSDVLLLEPNASNPNQTLSPFWTERGRYVLDQGCSSSFIHVWRWNPKEPKVFLFGIDHHHAVLWDMKQTLRPLGIYLDFIWLCDGRPPVNEAIPGEAPPFKSSLDIYKTPVTQGLDTAFKQRIQESYNGIITSHSLITAFRLREIELPQFHINSTRFGNEWIADPKKHSVLVNTLQEMLQKEKLSVIHNNKGDLLYFHQFFPSIAKQECVLPSICENIARKRFHTVNPMKFLIWDTRQVLIQSNKSPFMKQLYTACKHRKGDAFDSQAILLAEAKTYLPEGYLDSYTAVIHIPYNISTMSIFQQVTANIPVWIPSKTLLQKLWTDPLECNELSWTIFSDGSEKSASFLDQARNPEAVKVWIESADFYDKMMSDCIFTFDSIEDLLNKIFTVNYQEAIEKNQKSLLKYQENTIATWESIFRPLRRIHKN